jgi:hypothetical protein
VATKMPLKKVPRAKAPLMAAMSSKDAERLCLVHMAVVVLALAPARLSGRTHPRPGTKLKITRGEACKRELFLLK